METDNFSGISLGNSNISPNILSDYFNKGQDVPSQAIVIY